MRASPSQLLSMRLYHEANRSRRLEEMRAFRRRQIAVMPELDVWKAMRKRCNNPRNLSWARYGGRGIAVRYPNFYAFLSDVGCRPSSLYSIDRINNDGNYEPGNCRWATASQQAKNRCARKRISGRYA